jgi:hypothetical protein
MKALPLLAAALIVTAGSALADEPAAEAFSWRATLDTGGQQGLVRLPLPAEALARLQTRHAADLRVFDAQGGPVAFALATPPRPDAAARQQTAPLRALPLHAAPAGARPPRGALQMRVDQNGPQQSVWVQLGESAGDAAKPPGTTRLPAALFDTRALKEPVSGFLLRSRVPANVPVRFTLSASPDLAHWSPVPVQGRIYRFEGDGAPANDRLELDAPLRLQDRYLRLDWSGQEGVSVDAVVGLLAAAEPARPLPALALPDPVADGATALEWQLPFATPIARLELMTNRANTLVPLRLLGRNQPSEPWRLLARTVVYRLGPPGQESTNSAAVLQQPSMRWLRVEATHGMRLEGVPLAARVLFEPVEVVFPAGGAGPYQLAAGRAGAPSAALPLAMLAATTATRVEALPQARITSVQAEKPRDDPWQRWLPRGVDSKTAGLWLVLLLGVLLLGGVAWSLLKQVNGKPS